MRIVHSAVVITTFVATCCANAQYADGTVKIGILSDMSSIYSDIGGPGSVIAAKLAIEDFRPAAKGMKVEIVSADMQNKPDVGVSIANTWFDVDKVDVIVDGMNSGVSLAVSEATHQKNKLIPGNRRGNLGPHRSEVQSEYNSLGLRHLGARQQHRQGYGQNWRRHLVLHYRGLRIRVCARTRCHGCH
jgi:archaellum component FlaF (FlaF/FlaG flagellin family)